MRREKRHMNRANQLVGKFGELVKRKYGFVADPTWPLWKNVERRIGEMSEEEFNMRPANMACHNLLRDGIQLPNGTKTLLGLGLNYCIKSSLRSKITTKHTFTRLREDARRMYALRDAQDQGDYIQSLYSLKDIRLNIPTFSPPPPLSLSLSLSFKIFPPTVFTSSLAFSPPPLSLSIQNLG